jgi:quinol-cytochrome oxidoreductase complex cytochrome b subunit
MTSKSISASAYDWVDERLGISELAAFARHKTVPVHSQSFWYYWGGISLFLFLVQCFTGVLLLVYYRPGADAYESVRQITFVMHFGWLIRSAHAWSANLMIFSILVHMFSVYFMKAYRKPREFGWLSGMALLGIASVFGFSGYLLAHGRAELLRHQGRPADSRGHSLDRPQPSATCCAAARGQ